MNKRGRFLPSIIAAFFVLTMLVSTALAVPHTINYQGYLEGPGGTPVNATVSMVFAIYNAPTGDIRLWTETQDVVVTDGAFSVILGSVSAINLPFDEQYYLGVTVDEDAEMTPRAVLVSVPYAMRAAGVDVPLDISGATSADIINGVNTGTGRAGYFQISNPSSGVAAVKIDTDGGGSAIYVRTVGTGKAGYFRINNASNSSSALYAATDGTGYAAEFSGGAGVLVTGDMNVTGNIAGDGTGLTGVPVGAHEHSGFDVKSDYIADVHIASTIARDSEIMPTVLANDGAGSTLDADKLDGQDAANFLDKATYDAGADGKVDSANNADSAANATNASYLEGLNVAALDERYVHALHQVPRSNIITTVDSAGRLTSIAIGADGLPVISYFDDTTGYVKVAHCGDASCSASNTLTTLDPAREQNTSIAIGVDGWPVISYSSTASNNELMVAHCGDIACSTGNTMNTVDSSPSGDVGHHSSIAVGTDGLPVMSHHDYASGTLRVAHCGDTNCLSGNTVNIVDATGVVGEYTSISIGMDGLPVISYYDKTNGNLKVTHCGDASCTTGNNTNTVDSSGDVGQYTSIAIGADGWPVISYYDKTNGNLKVAHCGDASCTTANITNAVDSSGDVGQYTSIAIGEDGWPVISYYDFTNMDLKVAKCWDDSCARTTINTLDSEGEVGLNTSIAIAPDAKPVISYLDLTNFVLKVLKCANELCLNNWTRR